MPEDAQYLEKLLSEWRSGLDGPKLEDAIHILKFSIAELEDELAIKTKIRIRNQYSEED